MFGDLGRIPFAVFATWCDHARTLNEFTPTEKVSADAPTATSADRAGRAWEDFNRRGTWEEAGLLKHGWSWVRRGDNDTGTLRRPNKDGGGISATAGHCTSQKNGWPLFFNFSTSVPDFDSDHGYSRASVYAILEHEGDFKAAAKALADKGYGKHERPGEVYFGERPKQSEQGAKSGGDPDADYDFATNEDLKRLDLGVRWVWDRWLQFSTVNLLAAEGGLGKTRFMADLCRRVHCGLPWPDGSPMTPWDSQYLAMWVAGDRNQGELLTLSESFGFGDRICYSGSKKEPLGGVTLNTHSDFLSLYKKARAARPLFLIVDTAGGATGFNLAKQEDARAFFAPLSDMAANLNLCVVVITHLNASKKVLGKRAEERVRCVIRMSAENREPTTLRRMEVVKSNSLFPAPLGMLLGEDGNEYTNEPPPSPEDESGFGGSGGQRSASSNSDDPGRGPPTKTRDCMDWLNSVLEEKPMRVHLIRKEAENRGFSPQILYRAKESLNLIESESEGYKIWGLRK